MTWAKLTRKDKRVITSDWNALFPELGVYKPMHMLNRLGPLLIGILLHVKSGNDSYIPTFHVHNLANPFPVVSLGLETTLKDKYVHLEWHEKQYRELTEKIRQTAAIPLAADVHLDSIINGYRAYMLKPKYLYMPSTYEDLILTCAWCGEYTQVQKCLELAEEDMKSWPERIFTEDGGLNNWLRAVEDKTRDRDRLITISNQQCIDLKADHLPVRRILI